MLNGRHPAGIAKMIAVAGALAVITAACGGGGGSGGSGSGGSGSGDERIVVGTTDKVTSFDPAGAYDLGSWTILYNTYQRLLRYPPGDTTPQPDAAESCEFTDEDNTVYVCTLREGLTFSNGDALTAEDVVFSFERVLRIETSTSPSSIIANMESVEATGEREVTFTLKEPDATWPNRLATNAAAIVPAGVYPEGELQPDSDIVGSGPYKLEQYEPGQRVVLAPNEHYTGDRPVRNGGAVITYFQEPSALKLAIEQGDVDVAYRNLSPTDIADLRGQQEQQDFKVVEGNGTEIRYIAFEVSQEPVDEKAVRQALAMTIDRQAIADRVYNGTVQPLYSMVPQGVEHATQAFKERYGAGPDVEGATQRLQQAGVTTPVPITIWWTPSHYGAVSSDEYVEIQRQLEESGLFEVTLQNAEWRRYSQAYKQDQYAAWQVGWFPDFPDADNYTGPFFYEGGYFENSYSNDELNQLIERERAVTDPAQRRQAFREIQRIAAEDVPTLPIWQGRQVAVTGDDVTGVTDTFDASFVFRLWLIGKSG